MKNKFCRVSRGALNIFHMHVSCLGIVLYRISRMLRYIITLSI